MKYGPLLKNGRRRRDGSWWVLLHGRCWCPATTHRFDDEQAARTTAGWFAQLYGRGDVPLAPEPLSVEHYEGHWELAVHHVGGFGLASHPVRLEGLALLSAIERLLRIVASVHTQLDACLGGTIDDRFRLTGAGVQLVQPTHLQVHDADAAWDDVSAAIEQALGWLSGQPEELREIGQPPLHLSARDPSRQALPALKSADAAAQWLSAVLLDYSLQQLRDGAADAGATARRLADLAREYTALAGQVGRSELKWPAVVDTAERRLKRGDDPGLKPSEPTEPRLAPPLGSNPRAWDDLQRLAGELKWN